jgi:GT2 family glycosyltransferase/glycosyltransferase involved in cell wall biosynthesis
MIVHPCPVKLFRPASGSPRIAPVVDDVVPGFGLDATRRRTPRYRLDPAWAAAQTDPRLDPAEATARAVALGNRLLDVEAITFGLRAENDRLRRARGGTGSGGGGWFDVPRTIHGWPLAEQPTRDPASLDPYERRVDDPVILEAQRGQRFLTRFDLTGTAPGTAPDWAGAVAALDAATLDADAPRLRLVPPDSGETPDVSIIIPVYAQLAFTLNCLDSLLAQQSRASAEILVIDDCSPDESGAWLSRIAAIRTHRQPENGGFIDSCNAGARRARGRYLLMLNNDTRVAEGWLDALVDTFALFPRAGLVGSKLFYPDGSLQEAGGIIWRDGRAANYGRDDDPNRPHYAHARPVDYVSGCSILLPADLWQDLGGFDPLYRPAYCEDADLCLRIAARGQEVWMQPQSRVIHYEGKTSGTDIRTGVKAYQRVNQRKLFLRWRQSLETHRPYGEAPYAERERGVRRRLLVIDATTPTPDQDAGSVQTLLALEAAQALGYKTHFVSEHNWLFQPGYTTELQRRGVECAYAPFDRDIDGYMRRYGHLFDVILVYRVNVLGPIIETIRRAAPQAALLFHVADLHYLRVQREAEKDRNPEGFQEAALVQARELALVRAADCTITHSTVEAAILAEAVPEAPIAVWPLMFRSFGTQAPFAARRDICFLGGYRHAPNVDAVQYFVERIFPLIRARDPAIRFIIAGANPTREVRALQGEGIEVIGQVPDLADLFDRVRVFVCPLRVGAGVKGKIVSALSYGIPVVSTSVGVEGAGLEADVHVLVADTAEDFAARTLALHEDERRWNRLSAAGQAIVARDFSPEMGRSRLDAAIETGYRHRLGLDAGAR